MSSDKSCARSGTGGLGFIGSNVVRLLLAERSLTRAAALERGRSGEVYNFGGDAERENLDVVRQVLEK
jgi:dTDP-D-glucose 4,6-dehydratase